MIRALLNILTFALCVAGFLFALHVIDKVTAQEKTVQEKALEMIRRDAEEPGPQVIKESFPIGVDHMDAFIEKSKSGQVKYVHINRMGKKWHLVFGVFGGKQERALDLSDYPAVRGQIFKLLLMREFNHLTMLYEVERPKVTEEEPK